MNPLVPEAAAASPTRPPDPRVRAGGCEWLPGGIRIQWTRCEDCMWGQCPGGWHQWAGLDDIEHAHATGQPDPSGQVCGCVCVDHPSREPDAPDPDAELDIPPCPICGEPGACAYDSEGRPLIHTQDDEDDE